MVVGVNLLWGTSTNTDSPNNLIQQCRVLSDSKVTSFLFVTIDIIFVKTFTRPEFWGPNINSMLPFRPSSAYDVLDHRNQIVYVTRICVEFEALDPSTSRARGSVTVTDRQDREPDPSFYMFRFR